MIKYPKVPYIPIIKNSNVFVGGNPVLTVPKILFVEANVVDAFKMMDIDGSNISLLAPNPGEVYSSVSLSVDNRKVVWTARPDPPGVSQVYVGNITVSGGITGVQQLSSETVNRFMLPRFDATGDFVLWHGDSETKLRGYKLSTSTYYTDLGAYYGAGWLIRSASFNEAGDKLYYTNEEIINPNVFSLVRADFNLSSPALSNHTLCTGTNIEDLANIVQNDKILGSEWTGTNDDIISYDTWNGLNASNPRTFVNNAGREDYPYLSPDQQWVVYSDGTPGNQEIYKKPANSNSAVSDSVRLTTTAAQEYVTAWGNIPK